MNGVATADVTVVVVTWRARALVLRCLEGLARQELDGLRMHVVVVDNDSRDGTAEAVHAAHPEVQVVVSDVNRGFAGGNNLALRAVDSPVVVLLNNDAVPEPTFVARLVGHLRAAAPEVAAVTGRVLLADRFRPAADGESAVVGPDGRWVADPAGDVLLVNSTGNVLRTDGYGVDRGWLARADGHHPPREVFGFCGAGVALRTDALRDVGLFDEDFFLYYEDSDLSWRLRLAGYRVEYAQDAVLHHEHAASTREGSDLFRFHDWRNRLLLLTKDATARRAVAAVLRFVVTTASVALRRHGSRGEVRVRLRVLASYVRLLPAMLARRRTIGRRARVTRAEVERLLVPPAPSGGLRA
ncbi:glycosyltransferase family 2 protein [Cellulomonas sp. JZ18]|uniref:glycosyltransferase family 2 protein n=1 Tax=Cellulomonas sp. JZ18 TaxID=2654191 RepID=UPI0018AFA21B|nr:glycosyltransferase family 2 protein [Cellulomonas sp. JZ18]